MTDTEKCAHDLAIAYIRTYPPVLDDQDEKFEESKLQKYAATYEDAYKYFKCAISSK